MSDSLIRRWLASTSPGGTTRSVPDENVHDGPLDAWRGGERLVALLGRRAAGEHEREARTGARPRTPWRTASEGNGDVVDRCDHRYGVGGLGLQALLARFERHRMATELVPQGGQHLQLEGVGLLEAKRVKSEVAITGAGTPRSMASCAVQRLFARIDHDALDVVEAGTGPQGPLGQIQQPAAHHRAVAPDGGDLVQVEVELVGLAHDLEALGVGLHEPVLDAVVHLIDEVARPDRAHVGVPAPGAKVSSAGSTTATASLVPPTMRQ